MAIAERMQGLGYDAYSLKGAIETPDCEFHTSCYYGTSRLFQLGRYHG